MRAAIIIAPEGFQDREFEQPYSTLKKNGIDVDVYSTKKGIATGRFGLRIQVDHELSSLDAGKYDAIIFIGGPGTPLLRHDKDSSRAAREAFDAGKIVAAICWSPTILANAGILKGRKATVWYGEDDEYDMLTSEYLEEQGADYVQEHVVVDQNIITADGPEAAYQYAQAIILALRNR